MKENVVKSFLRDTYQTSSPIPFIITGQAVIFVLMHIFELVAFAEITDNDLFSFFFTRLSLPASLIALVRQPWAIFTHPFIYHGIFDVLFDCLWLYWIGTLFLNLLSNRQFWMTFGGGLLGGALLYILIGQFAVFQQENYWNTTAFGLAALIGSMVVLAPSMEVRLFLFGNVKFKTIALVYLGLDLIFTGLTNVQAILPYVAMIGYGMAFMYQLKKGNDWSAFVKLGRRRKLKVIHKKVEVATSSRRKYPSDMPNQDEIDRILDKISQSGYDSLTSHDKEVLFRASKQDQ